MNLGVPLFLDEAITCKQQGARVAGNTLHVTEVRVHHPSRRFSLWSDAGRRAGLNSH